jgi:4-alpha-glucanotransferase
MDYPRSSGILLHPTSLPGPYGMGELSSHAYRFVDYLADAEQTLWQVMPLGPTGYGDSPYQSFSAFAGNPMLISLERLANEGRLTDEDLAGVPDFPTDRVDYGPVLEWRGQMLRQAYERFKASATPEEREWISGFAAANATWLTDFALFMALKEKFQSAWSDWPADIRSRQPDAMVRWRAELADEVQRHIYYQYEFDRQWSALHAYATSRGVAIMGDIPIFVAYDSAEAWSQPELFYFDAEGQPTEVAGVPPDYFSPTGQLWGNPLYKWDYLAKTNYGWWIERFRRAFSQVDLVRLDHFRGFQAYWAVPAAETTAINGVWTAGPGAALFEAVRDTLGPLPIIAEDLGVITPQVNELRDGQGFPGMRVLQFAFASDSANPYLPHQYVQNTVVYTGTHDNDTTVGWFWSVSEEERAAVREYVGTDGHDIHWDLIRLALMSVARWAVFPMQDVMGLGTEARMNTPGRGSGNWGWRLQALPDEAQERLRRLTRLYGRGPVAHSLEQAAVMAALEGVDVATASKTSASRG